jgi:hypothetical protein
MVDLGWSLLSPEFIGFVLILSLYMKLRKASLLSVRVVEGLIAVVPPTDEDFKVLEKSN